MPLLFSQGLIIFVIGLLSFSVAPLEASAQTVLYLELMKEEKPVKYYEGQVISLRTKQFPKDWQQIKIERIMDEEQLIIYDGGMIALTDITQIRKERRWAKVGGAMLQTFGTSWLAFGGIAHLTTDFTFGYDTLIIGGTSIAVGWLVRKLFRYKKYKIGKRNRVKILDLSWPEPTGGH